MAVPLSNIRDLLLPGLANWKTTYKTNSADFSIEYAKPQVLDPAFSLDELEAAQSTIDAITKK